MHPAPSPRFASTRTLAALLLLVVGLAIWRWLLPWRGATELRWQAPDECVQVYLLRIDEEFSDPSVEVFLARPEEHASYLFGLAPSERVDDAELLTARALIMPADPSAAADQTRRRELAFSPTTVGPAAPDLACRRRSWDPLEDALALGWPKLPEHPVRPGDTWLGHVVGGRCHETPCLDDHAKPSGAVCRARPWQERFVGWADDDPSSGRVLLRSDWDDVAPGSGRSREGGPGILTSREVVIGQGRPLLVRMQVEEHWVGVRRNLELRAIDDCTTGAPLFGLAGEDQRELETDKLTALVDRVRANLGRP